MKSSRPTYAIMLLVLSSLWMCASFLPLLYSVVFPNRDIEEVLFALEGSGTAPPEAAPIVQQAIAAAGPLRRAVKVGYYSGVTTAVRMSGSHTSERVNQATYIAWFQKLPRPIVITITRSESDGGQRAFGVNEVDPVSLVRGYAPPVFLFGVSLFLVRRRQLPPSTS